MNVEKRFLLNLERVQLKDGAKDACGDHPREFSQWFSMHGPQPLCRIGCGTSHEGVRDRRAWDKDVKVMMR